MRVWLLHLLLATVASPAEVMPERIGEVVLRGGPAPVTLKTQASGMYDPKVIDGDVRALFATGRFSDVRVESDAGVEGRRVTFVLVRAERLMLGKIHVIPDDFPLKSRIPAGEPIHAARARAIGWEYQRQLRTAGWIYAEVTPELVVTGPSVADVRLHVSAGARVRVGNVQIDGDPGFGRKALRELKRRWLRSPTYSTAAVEGDVARVQSALVARGYVDAVVRLDHTEVVGGKADISLLVQAGKRYPVRGDLCECLAEERRDAEKRGVIDFSARASIDAAGMLTAHSSGGRSYVVRRIEFTGNRRFSDASIRRNLLIQEAELLDPGLIRASLERLNRAAMFEPLSESDVDVRTEEKSGLADIRIHLKERKAGSWLLSGPAGPVSIAGPFRFTIASRLPSWGQGILDLTSYYASLHLGPGEAVLALQRPFVPGQALLSGFAIAPQLGWRNMAAGYVGTQIRERFLIGDALSAGAIPVTVERAAGETTMLCEAPTPRWAWLRRGASMALQLGSMMAL